MSMSEVNKGGRPREEPTNVRSVRLPNRVWKLVQKASKGSRSVNEYIQTLIENDLIKRKMLKKSERKKLSSKTSTKRSQEWHHLKIVEECGMQEFNGMKKMEEKRNRFH